MYCYHDVLQLSLLSQKMDCNEFSILHLNILGFLYTCSRNLELKKKHRSWQNKSTANQQTQEESYL